MLSCAGPNPARASAHQDVANQAQASLPSAKATVQPTRPRNTQIAKSISFLSSFSRALKRVGRRSRNDRRNRMTGVAAAIKAMILNSMLARSRAHSIAQGEEQSARRRSDTIGNPDRALLHPGNASL